MNVLGRTRVRRADLIVLGLESICGYTVWVSSSALVTISVSYVKDVSSQDFISLGKSECLELHFGFQQKVVNATFF